MSENPGDVYLRLCNDICACMYTHVHVYTCACIRMCMFTYARGLICPR